MNTSADVPAEVLVVEPVGFERLRSEVPQVASRLVDAIRDRFRVSDPGSDPTQD